MFKLVTDGACLTNVTVDTRLLRATMYISVMCSVIMHNILLSEFFYNKQFVTHCNSNNLQSISSTLYHYNGVEWYEQFLQVSRLDRSLMLLGLALSSEHICVFDLHGTI